MALKETNIKTLSFNPFTKIGGDWLLITAGDAQSHNTMTASWGGFGVLWGRDTATVYIRPQRYTRRFADKHDCFSLCFFGDGYRDALNFCGTKSGRDYDKPTETGLTPNFSEAAPYYEEGELVFICRKLYTHDFEESLFTDTSVVKTVYPERDFHRLYVGEIIKVLSAAL